MQIIQGLIGMTAGFLILIFRARLKDLTGSIGFAERYFGVGGTWTFYALLGVAVFIVSLMWATGTLQGFMLGTFGKFL